MKRLLILALIVVSAFALTGCGHVKTAWTAAKTAKGIHSKYRECHWIKPEGDVSESQS